jgi:hypothetical protein
MTLVTILSKANIAVLGHDPTAVTLLHPNIVQRQYKQPKRSQNVLQAIAHGS